MYGLTNRKCMCAIRGYLATYLLEGKCLYQKVQRNAKRTHDDKIFFRKSYCFPEISELQFPNQQPLTDHLMITLLHRAVVMQAEIDGGSEIIGHLCALSSTVPDHTQC
jgi:hypothetical protein